MGNLTGTPGARTTITDLSIIVANQLKGIWCVQGKTQRGVPGVEYLLGNWNEFLQSLGGFLDDDDFPMLCKNALDNGAVLRVTPAIHYTDITDIATADGTKATLAAVQVEVLATGTVTITDGTVAGGNEVSGITVNAIEVMSGAELFDTDNDTTAAAVAANITAHTSAPDYNAAAVGAVITITALVGTGDGPNGFVVTPTFGGDVTGTATDMAGGINAGTGNFEAEAAGIGYNTAAIVVVASASGLADKIDIEVTLPGGAELRTVSDVVNNPDAQGIIDINAELSQFGVILLSITDEIPLGSFTLTGGVDGVAITDADFKGDAVQKNGWFAFDGVTDSMRIANVNRANPTADIDLVAYVDGRKDMRAWLRTPLGLLPTALNAYLDGTTPYSHQRVDSIYATYFYTDVEINDPDNANVHDRDASGIGFAMGKRSRIDGDFGEWFSSSGTWGGQLNGINKVEINFVAAGNKTQYDVLYEKGLNAIVQKGSKVVPWGNRNTFSDKTKLTSKDNIADLVVFISRVVKDIADDFSFKPNDVIMFNELYRRVRPFITDVLVTNRAIQGDNSATQGEGVWWHWLGDQFAQDPSEFVTNNPVDVDAGKYKVRFAFKPIAANEYIAIDIAPADSVTILNVQILNEI